ncbi:hypothetical protein DSO57_1005404 [Entomophthora muscae]|uniref:Uncharacterized protein n=1 Tax=Entomophthora muscae TaxID=34485 RepID=A0ACC2TVL1_9FUNG|nr:hypothetical protein DSO57_1005404 [Entomophthora muscae]
MQTSINQMKLITLILVSVACADTNPTLLTLDVTEIKAYNEANPVAETIKVNLTWPAECNAKTPSFDFGIDNAAAEANAAIDAMVLANYTIKGTPVSGEEKLIDFKSTDAPTIRNKKIKTLFYTAETPIDNSTAKYLEFSFKYVAQNLANGTKVKTELPLHLTCDGKKYNYNAAINVNGAAAYSTLFAIGLALISPFVTSL